MKDRPGFSAARSAAQPHPASLTSWRTLACLVTFATIPMLARAAAPANDTFFNATFLQSSFQPYTSGFAVGTNVDASAEAFESPSAGQASV